jgi:hypothetical protein
MRTAALPLGIALLWSVTGCGGGEAKSSLPDLPKRDDIWVLGKSLPKDYKGCISGSDQVVQRDFKNCGLSNGKQSEGRSLLYWYQDGVSTFYAHGNDTLNKDWDWEIKSDDHAGTDMSRLAFAKKVCSLPHPRGRGSVRPGELTDGASTPSD